MTDLGRLERQDLRSVWTTEDRGFTPWLARDDNLALLGEAVGIDLELEAEEKNVGPFRADILCKDTLDNSWVLIENQLERTDHTYLGQLMTYAAELHAVTVIWIAARFTDEHRAALDWLNEVTDDTLRFFGLEVELWRIGGSAAAPKFNIVSKPNDWSRSVSQAARRAGNGSLSETRALQLQFWTHFANRLEDHTFLRAQTPRSRNGMGFTIGRAGFSLGARLSSDKRRIGVYLYIGGADATDYFRLLREQELAIEDEIGFSLEWYELPDRIASRIECFLEDIDPLERENWPKCQDWFVDHLERFRAVFQERVRCLEILDSHDGDPDGDSE